MVTVVLKNGDYVELWNGSKGKVVSLDFPFITILVGGKHLEVFHRMNIKYVDDVLFDGRDVVF